MGLRFTNFTSCSAYFGTPISINLTASIALNNAQPSGSAHAEACACGICPSASGNVDTQVNGVGNVAISATGTLNSTANCVQISPGTKAVLALRMYLCMTHTSI